MKTNTKLFAGVAVAIAAIATPNVAPAAEVNGWGDFKLYLDPGHSGKENAGIWGYSEAEKTYAIAQHIKDMLETYTDMPAENLKICRDETTVVSLQERTDEANAWGADFFYAIHSDAGATVNKIVLLFGGWMRNGEEVEKTPNGGKAYGEFLDPNLSGVMRVGSRGNYYDRCFYYPGETHHANQYPYLHVNRESNMASLLSEGAYHTIAYQQARNMNKEYKRLEALAAFQSILKYHGMEVPSQTFLHGEISNSENGQFINGAVVTVKKGDEVVGTYTTDTYESLFHLYSKNPDLIHNGLFTFEGLEAGAEYTIEVEAEGFTPVSKTVTINTGGEHTADYVTYADFQLENTLPAKVDAISISDPANVSPIYPVTITFSRNMVRESVEEAFSVNNGGEIGLTWVNDYTLQLDLNELLPLWDYTITIDGSIAKNSQTGQFFDGDGDGEPGGNWVYTFTMAEPDLDAPVIVSTYPPMEGEVKYATRFPIRIEFDEEINWNEDHNGDCITLEDSEGNSYTGTVNHAVIRGNSVLHFFPDAELPRDKTFLVTVAPGLADMFGNTTPCYQFRFMSEYRAYKDFTEMLKVDGSAAEEFWNPGGSGSSAGLIVDESVTRQWNNVNPFSATGSSMEMYYVFDETDASEVWQVREYTKLNQSNSNAVKATGHDQILTYWIYGDGSNNFANMLVRCNSTGGGLKMRAEYTPVDFRGWNLFVWDLVNDDYEAFTGSEDLKDASAWYFDSFFFKHYYTDPDDEEIPQQAWVGSIGYHQFAYSHWDDNAERQATLDDVQLSAKDIEADNAGVELAVSAELLTIKAGADIEAAYIYGVDGAQVAVANGHGNVATAAIGHLSNGVYIVTVKTAPGTFSAKFVK
ncbi:MAG: Ig-like domain-containing protein [Muribaculaceae bacterium]|nr:Ig-like domain-containing protein [Muribaculaceae bacterium]